jgi:hypothetical protein
MFVTTLLRCGVIGQLEKETTGGKPSRLYFKAHFEHLMQGNLPFNERLTYCVHPVMADAFDMRRLHLGRVVYPMPTDGDLWLEQEAEIT